MIIIGCDFHPSWQQICWLDEETGETAEQKLVHGSGEAQKFYQHLAAPARIGMEATGNCQWFVEMAKAAGHEVWIGDAARIRASDVRQQKHDRRDAALLLQLLLEGRFPRIWTPSSDERDLRQLLIHRYKLVRLRAQAKNGLQHLAMNQGLQKKRRLWSEAGQKLLRELALQPWASRRREDLFGVMELLDGQIGSLDTAVKEAAEKDPNARLLMTRLRSYRGPPVEKSSRVIDAAKVENGRVTKASQVIRPNKNGTPPAREVRAARDIERATGVKPQMVPVRPATEPQ